MDMDPRIWPYAFEDIVFLIIARLSWDHICRLSCEWKTLNKAVTHQGFFEDFARGHLQKPICVLKVQNLSMFLYRDTMTGSQLNASLAYTVAAGDADREPHDLFTLRAKGVGVLNSHVNFNRPWTAKSEMLFHISTWWAAGCFVLLKYSNFPEEGDGQVPRRRRTIRIIMNPANGTARQITSPHHRSDLGAYRFWDRDSQMFVNGMFKDGDSHYQILAKSYDLDATGRFMYFKNLPKEEDLGRILIGNNDDRKDMGPYHAIFFLYTSRTRSWRKLLGSNTSLECNFVDPVLYKGVIYALLVFYTVYPGGCTSTANGYDVYSVGETAGRKRWVSLEVPLPNRNLQFAHLFVFQGTLMLIAALSQGAGRWLIGSVRIWRLHDEGKKTWVEEVRLPEPIINNSPSELYWENFRSMRSVSSNGDYVMLRGNYDSSQYGGESSLVDCILLYNILTRDWQLLHWQINPPGRYSERERFVSIFEHKLNIDA